MRSVSAATHDTIDSLIPHVSSTLNSADGEKRGGRPQECRAVAKTRRPRQPSPTARPLNGGHGCSERECC